MKTKLCLLRLEQGKNLKATTRWVTWKKIFGYFAYSLIMFSVWSNSKRVFREHADAIVMYPCKKNVYRILGRQQN